MPTKVPVEGKWSTFRSHTFKLLLNSAIVLRRNSLKLSLRLCFFLFGSVISLYYTSNTQTFAILPFPFHRFHISHFLATARNH
jgi:hypothetical protein